MSDAPFRIVIVGGGTAGWLSAAYLQRTLTRGRRKVEIAVVESEDIETIGVGEATIPSFVGMMRELDIPEFRLFSEADATFKNAIRFAGWARAPEDGTAAEHFYHQFDQPPVVAGHSAMVHWLALRDAGLPVEPLHMATSIGSALCDANRSPLLFSSPQYEAPLPYAYHLDARKLGNLLRSTAISRGVEHIVGTVVSADQDDAGDIVALQLSQGRDIEGDLFVDCSGFRALLIEGVMGSTFESYNDRLLCDRAVATHVPRSRDIAPRSYTTATAAAAGWIWEIDLNSRGGAGYVYSSRFTSDEEAEAVLRAHLGVDGLAPRVVPMRVGRRAYPWTGNCVAIGLSAGFLEPLESSGIHMIELGVRLLSDHLAAGPQPGTVLRSHYNKLIRNIYDHVADFLVMHYALNGRRGQAFWDHCRNDLPLPDSLASKLMLWSHKVPALPDIDSPIRVFESYSYFAIMAGLGTLPQLTGNLSSFIDLKTSAEALDMVRHFRDVAVRTSPPHAEMVQKLHSSGI